MTGLAKLITLHGLVVLLVAAVMFTAELVRNEQIDQLRDDIALLENEAAWRDDVINDLIVEIDLIQNQKED